MDMPFKFFACCLAVAFIAPVLVFALGIRGVRSAKSPAERKAILRMFEVLVPSLSIRGLLQNCFSPGKNENRGE